jgi:K+-sensing histidine kinase KdpD
MECKSIKKILVAIDYSRTAEFLIEYALCMHKNIGSEVVLYHISNYKEKNLNNPNSVVQKIKKDDRITKFDCIVEFGNSPEKEIIRFSQANNFDLILIGKNRHSPLKKNDVKEEIENVTKGYTSKKGYFTDKLSQSIATIAAAFYPKEVIVPHERFQIQ